MTTDPDLVSTVRAALTAATPAQGVDEFIQWATSNQINAFTRDRAFLLANAPVWLASLISEVERLRAEVARLNKTIERLDDVAFGKVGRHE